MNNIIKVSTIAILVLELKRDGVPTDMLLSGLAIAIDMLIEKDNLDYKETWKHLYIQVR